MPYKFFDNLLESKSAGKTKRKLTLPVSIGIHILVLGAVLLVPLLTFSDLPEPVMSSAIRAYLVEAAPPPPPPPPPPPAAASAPKTVTTPKVEQPKPSWTTSSPPPSEGAKPEPATGLGPARWPGGEIRGVQAGEGPEGGVVGGTIGGVGGELGGRSVASPPRHREGRASRRRPDRSRGRRDQAPSKLNNVAPAYPPMAKQARGGTVILEATIGPAVSSGGGPRAAFRSSTTRLDAVRRERPTLLNGTRSRGHDGDGDFRLNGDGRRRPRGACRFYAPAGAHGTAPTPPPSR
jgi:hypothetical protein